MIASEKPRNSMTRPSSTYIAPRRLWSTLVTHSRHRYGNHPLTATITSTARITAITTAMLISGSGSSNGIAAQLSRPSMSASRRCRRTPGRAGNSLVGASRRHPDDMLEKIRRYRAIGRRRHGLARLCQLRIGRIVKRGPGAAHTPEPSIEIARRHRLRDELHVWKTVTAEHRGKTGIGARFVRQQVQMSRHAAHRVDLAAKLRDEKRVHDRRRSNAELHRRADRKDELIDRRDALIGIDEQPLPIERDDMDAQRLGI